MTDKPKVIGQIKGADWVHREDVPSQLQDAAFLYRLMTGLLGLRDFESEPVAETALENGAVISTVWTSDNEDDPYETAISDKHYQEGDWIVVEAYVTKDEAIAGHDKWAKTMTEENPPLLRDIVHTNLIDEAEKTDPDNIIAVTYYRQAQDG